MLPNLSSFSTEQQNKLFKELRIAITYHSSKIERITLTYKETKILLENNIAISNKPLNDILEVKGFANCFDKVVQSGFNKIKIDEKYIKDLHLILFENALQECPAFVDKPIGAFRTDERKIAGSNIELALPNKISVLIGNLLYQAEPTTIKEIADFHRNFERIHPFANGNGRLGRLLMIMQFIKNDMIPPLIKNDFRVEYLDSFSSLDKMTNLLEKSQQISYTILKNDNYLNFLLDNAEIWE